MEGWMSGLNRTPGKRVQVLWPDAGSNPAPSATSFNCNSSVYPINKGFNHNALLKIYCILVYREQYREQLSSLKHYFFNQFGVINGYN